MHGSVRPRCWRLAVILAASLLLWIGAVCPRATAQTVWTGPQIEFVKPEFADVSDPANRDIILPGLVEITRGEIAGIFNFAPRGVFE